MKRIFITLLALLLVFNFSVSAEKPQENENALSLNSKSSILMEVNTGKVIYENCSDEQLPPASITKIMSLILIMEYIESGNLTLDTVITCSDTAAALGGSQIWLEPGEQMTVDELLKAVVIVSANDATVLLAETVAGSEESFVVLMNEKAKEFGMKNTNFINSTGLDAQGHYSSARDVAIMACELLKHEQITKYSTVWMDSLRNGESELVNTNRLVRYYEGCTGLKTGTTSTAGYCLAASAKRNDLSLVAVVMNASTSNDRFADAQKLLNYGFANYAYVNVPAELTGNEHIAVKNGVRETVAIKVNADFNSLIKKSDVSAITQKVDYKKEITAPKEKGYVVGTVNYYLKEELIGSVDIVTAENCEKLSFIKALWFLVSMLFAL